MQESATPPPLLLNRHCAECEFRRTCREAAAEKDDLSLLRGLSPREIAVLNRRGIFTVTQFSYTFRPGRMKRAAGARRVKHDHSLQALAIRERKIYVCRRPQLADCRVRVYLDVEGLPDRDFYYLIGLSCDDGTLRRQLSFWADREADEPAIWAGFLSVIRQLGEDFVLFHYGSYETRFLKRMEARHGGDAAVLSRIKARAVNMLSELHGQVYFPVYSNDLKSVARCLGFQWSVPDSSGLQAVVWRCDWEATGHESAKQRLLTYNQEDCSALEAVVTAVRAFGEEAVSPGRLPGPPVASVGEIEGPGPRKYGRSKVAFPEFSKITRCAYFDYQRDKVLCRTSPAVKASVRRKKQPRPSSYRVNREVECGLRVVCPCCGSKRLERNARHQKLVIDLKPFRGGMKRWVTRYKVIRQRCWECRRTFLPDDYAALPSKYGWTLRKWITYASIALRQTNDAVAESLGDLFGISIPSGLVSKIRQGVVERYRETYEGLLADLRRGPVVHADETKVGVKGPGGDGYVWAFANPQTAAYVYAPTRDGETVRETLAGFHGVLVSDFYAAYDSVPCPQQKCLIHLIRDLNDDLLENPFDLDLKQIAARFTDILQAVISTIDRFGLKNYHLGKHKRDVERYLAAESLADYQSQVARRYQARILKYRDKLFTFLDHDGVPWNNNNAENAIKLFAARRKVMGTLFTQAGIRDYLLLLSIYQTLRYRHLSFWRFLLSGEIDIAAFTAKSR
jgi:hypothetical protein